MFINFDEVSTLLPKFQHCCRYSQFCCPNLERPLDFVRGKSNTVDKATLTALNSTLLRVCTGLTMISTSLGNSGLCWTVFTRNRDISVPAEGNGNLQTLICVLEARPRRCLTLSNPVPWLNWMAAYLGYTLRMKMLFCGWPVMGHETYMRRRFWLLQCQSCFYYCLYCTVQFALMVCIGYYTYCLISCFLPYTRCLIGKSYM